MIDNLKIRIVKLINCNKIICGEFSRAMLLGKKLKFLLIVYYISFTY